MTQNSIEQNMGARTKSSTVFSVQILRGIAALIVVMHHTMLSLFDEKGEGGRFIDGASGVDMFFVISGFVIYLTGRRLGWREFITRRIIRIVPLYWFFTTVKILFIMTIGAGVAKVALSGLYIASSYLFFPAYREVGDPRPIIAAAWTLNYEMFFYFIYAFSLGLLPKSKLVLGITTGIGLAVLVGCTLLFVPHSVPVPAAIYLLHPLCLEFLAGLGLALWWSRGLSLSRIMSLGLMIIGVSWIALCPAPHMFGFDRPLLWGVPSAMIVAGFLGLESKVNFCHWRPLLILGDASYALYLSHTAVLPLLAKIVLRLGFPTTLNFVILIAACVLIGLLTHSLIERPLLRGVSAVFRLTVRQPALKCV